MRRSIPIVAAVLGLGLTLTACSGDGSSNETTSKAPEPTTTTSEAPKLSGELTFWVDEERIKDFPNVAEAFEAEFGVKVNLVQKANGDLKTDFLAQVPTGKGPDLVIGAHDWVGEFVANGVAAPVQLGDAQSGLSGGSITAFSADGQLYGVPYAVENIALIRNNELVKETPATFDELIAQNDTTKAKYPVVVQQGKDGDAYHLNPLMTSFGISILATDATGAYQGEAGTAGDGGAAWAEWLAAQGEAGWLSPDIDGQIAADAFKNGETPYIITGPWNVTGGEGRFEEEGMDVSVLPIPSAGGETSKPFAGYQGIYVSAESTNKVAANAFVSYIARGDVQAELYKDGGRIPVASDAAAAVDNELLKGFALAGQDAVPAPSLKEMDSIWSNWGKTQVQIISGKATDPAGAWTELTNQINDLFK